MKKIIIKIFAAMLCAVLAMSFLLLYINGYVVRSSMDRIVDMTQVAELDEFDCILVLGCLVRKDGAPSDMLADRLRRGVELYRMSAAPKMLMSGDHSRKDYDEVGAMKAYAIGEGVPSTDIFMDHAGFSTYESIYRAREIFGADRVLIVTQEYHLYRALYLAESLGMEAYGVSADYNSYSGQVLRDIREIFARNKDFLFSLTKPLPTYLGECISIDGNGDVTNDQ